MVRMIMFQTVLPIYSPNMMMLTCLGLSDLILETHQLLSVFTKLTIHILEAIWNFSGSFYK